MYKCIFCHVVSFVTFLVFYTTSVRTTLVVTDDCFEIV